MLNKKKEKKTEQPEKVRKSVSTDPKNKGNGTDQPEQSRNISAAEKAAASDIQTAENQTAQAVENQSAENTASPDRQKHNWIWDIALVLVLACIGLGIFIYYRIQAAPSSDDPDELTYYVEVQMNNRTEALIPMDQEGEYVFRNIYSDGENVLCVENNGTYMKSANCPDQVCVYEGVIEPGTILPIVCMPNMIYVSIVEASDIDFSLVRDGIEIPESLQEAYEAYKNEN